MNTFGTALVSTAAGLAAAFAVIVPVTAASAASGSASGSGTGVLVATGTGTAQLSGDLRGSVVTGAGVLVVTDHGGDAKVVIAGRGAKKTSGNVTTYVGFNGKATITGSNVTVRLAGTNVRLAARGDGTFQVKGHGSYDTAPNAAGGEGVWTSTGSTGDL